MNHMRMNFLIYLVGFCSTRFFFLTCGPLTECVLSKLEVYNKQTCNLLDFGSENIVSLQTTRV